MTTLNPSAEGSAPFHCCQSTPDDSLSLLFSIENKVVEAFNASKSTSPEEWCKMCCPIVLRHNDGAILLPYQLDVIDDGGIIHDLDDVVQAPNLQTFASAGQNTSREQIFVRPTIMKVISMRWLRPVITLHARYCLTNLFLF